jgi:DNA-3-methyladenine glycosylase II
VSATTSVWKPHKAARALAGRDPLIARLVERAGLPAIPQYASSFESIARAIAYQQLAGPAARAIWGRVTALFGETGFTPAAVLRRRETTYRKAGLSGPKTRSLRDLARHVQDGRLVIEALPALSDEEVVGALTQVRGIGPWSAQMHLMFALRRPDVWPVLDLGVRKGWARLVGREDEPTARELEPLGETYRPYRSVLAWYLWRIHDVEPW